MILAAREYNNINNTPDNKTTNTILKIPQRIKYSLKDGVLTIKKGSIVIVPYGTEAPTLNKGDNIGTNGFWRVHDRQYKNNQLFYWCELTIDTIVSVDANTTGARMLFPSLNNPDYPFIYYSPTNVSSDSEPLNNEGVRYLTNKNVVGRYINNNWTLDDKLGLSILIFETNGLESSVDYIAQDFNGFGYIGSTTWVDKGVKVLLGNGLNDDGSLKNIDFVLPSLILDTVTFNNAAKRIVSITNEVDNYIYRQAPDTFYNQTTPPVFKSYNITWYNPDTNITRRSYLVNDVWVWVITPSVKLFEYEIENRFIKKFSADNCVGLLKRGDFNELSALSRPSGKYDNLVLKANGSTYIAPATGKYFWSGALTGSGFIALTQVKNGYTRIQRSYNNYSLSYTLDIEVEKGDEILLNITGTSVTTNYFRFVYAQGEV